jgi:hypothetical protein
MATACGALRARTERTRTHRGGHLHPDTRPQFRTLGLDPVGEESGWAASPKVAEASSEHAGLGGEVRRTWACWVGRPVPKALYRS